MDKESRNVPDLARADVGLVAIAEWSTGGREAQRAVADAALDAWDRVRWPEGLLSHWCLLGADGTTVLHYIQSVSEETVRGFVTTAKGEWARAVAGAAPPFQRRGVVGYQVYRGRYFAPGPRSPGCVATIRREFDGPGPRRAHAWVDAMFAATGDDTPLPGAIAAHMHVSVDGARVLNFAQWASEQAHQALVDDTPRRLAGNHAWRRVERSWPGLARTTMARYRPYRCLERHRT